MVTFIAGRIEKEAKKSVDKGREKYKAYFVNTTLYEEFRADVNTVLETDGYEACIVRS